MYFNFQQKIPIPSRINITKKNRSKETKGSTAASRRQTTYAQRHIAHARNYASFRIEHNIPRGSLLCRSRASSSSKTRHHAIRTKSHCALFIFLPAAANGSRKASRAQSHSRAPAHRREIRCGNVPRPKKWYSRAAKKAQREREDPLGRGASQPRRRASGEINRRTITGES